MSQKDGIAVISGETQQLSNNRSNSNKQRTINVQCANKEPKTNTSTRVSETVEGDVESVTLNASLNGKKESSDNDRARRKKRAWQEQTLNPTSSKLFWDPVIQETAKGFTEQQFSEFREIFSLFDKDRSGFISGRELFTVLRCVGQDPEEDEIKHIIGSLDINEDGVIEFSEFLTLMAQLAMDQESEAELYDVFRVLDQDDDGNITLRDLKEVSSALNLGFAFRDIDEMMAEVDKDGDGLIQFDEFRLIVTSRI